MSEKYDRGPEPSDDWSGEPQPSPHQEDEAQLARVERHRFNGWHTACDEIDRLRAILAELPAMAKLLPHDQCLCHTCERLLMNTIKKRMGEVAG